MGQDDVRMPVLKRLAEQSMSDAAFRREAAHDLEEALRNHDYDLNDRERELVTAFRETLDEAGVDLFLNNEVDLSALFEGASAADLDHYLDAHRKR